VNRKKAVGKMMENIMKAGFIEFANSPLFPPLVGGIQGGGENKSSGQGGCNPPLPQTNKYLVGAAHPTEP